MAGWEERMFFWMRLYGRVDDLICNLLKKNCENKNEWKKTDLREKNETGRERERKKSVRN
jgi:hypothetical protein